MKVRDLIQKLLDFDREYEVAVAEYYAIDEDNALRINHEIVGHMIDETAREVVFIIPNNEGSIPGSEE